ncbi:MAG: DMT family transporter [Bryobacteraceae bacterium]|nr:DMT family transporter [Bryobacteraceae bacterium]
MRTARPWLLFAILATLFWGVWGAFIEIPERAGFPATLGYAVWALTMAPCAAVVMKLAEWRLKRDGRSVLLGLAVGLTGAGGQLLLFQALQSGPAYVVFPLISLYPVVTVLLSVSLLGERAGRRGWSGIALALVAIPLLSWRPADEGGGAGSWWLLLTIVVLLMWGVQGWAMKFASRTMPAESIFFYMTASGLLLAPFAVAMTDFGAAINWGAGGAWLAAAVQTLNAVGAVFYVYAVRYGKAIVVVPMTSLFPVLTVVLSLAIYHTLPHPVIGAGMAMALVAIYLLAE